MTSADRVHHLITYRRWRVPTTTLTRGSSIASTWQFNCLHVAKSEGDFDSTWRCLFVSHTQRLSAVGQPKKASPPPPAADDDDKSRRRRRAVAVVRRSSSSRPLEQGETTDHDPVRGDGWVGCSGEGGRSANGFHLAAISGLFEFGVSA